MNIKPIERCGQCMCHTFDGCARLEHMVESGEIGPDDYRKEGCSKSSPSCDWATYPGLSELTNVSVALETWRELDDVTVDENSCIDVPYFNPYLGYFEVGTLNEDIWHAIEDELHVSVAWLMGESDKVW